MLINFLKMDFVLEVVDFGRVRRSFVLEFVVRGYRRNKGGLVVSGKGS